MRLKSFLCCSSLLVLLALPAMAAEPLAPRGEVSVKGGTDRSLLTTEFWAPLAQQSDRVLYGDIRLMGDNDENREGNLGVGYRQIKNDAVVGVHGWIDRRRTQHNSTFHQLTFGIERLGHIIDARANIYIPINNGRTIITPNIGVTSPYLAGSGIYYDTNGSINETPQYGLDGELGYRIPVFKKQIDAIRVYGGGYYFFRDNTVEVPGTRFRTEAQVNKIVSIGARVQYDKPRGTQGFLEATLKFPFSAKRLYQESGIRSRLDESPERDVDIVTDAKIDTGLFKPVVNTATGTQQRILYVDNTNTQSGDGSRENPFNSLKSAEAALQANDILYVNRGDGTTRNMDQGIVINKPNIQLIGSGSALTYSGYTLLNAGAAPNITNTQTANADNVLGTGVLVVADNASVSGLTIANTQKHGIYSTTFSGETLNSITINNVNVSVADGTNNKYPIWIIAQNGGTIKNVSLSSVTTSGGNGIAISALANSTLGNVSANHITSSNVGRGILILSQGRIDAVQLKDLSLNNSTDGVYITPRNGGTIGTIDISNLSATGNSEGGVRLSAASNGALSKLTISNSTVSGNRVGLDLRVEGSATVSEITTNNITANNNSVTGISATVNTSATLGNITNTNSTTNNNTQYGVYYNTATLGKINAISLSNAISNNNSITGIGIIATDSSTISNMNITNATANNNTQHGIFAQAFSATINNLNLSRTTTNNNLQYGTQITVASNGTINNTTITNGTANNNTQSGVYIFTNSGTINNTIVTNTTASSNIQHGVYLNSGTSAIMNGVTLSGITASNNAQNGLYINGANATTSVMNNISVASSNFLNNTATGIVLQKANAGATFTVDLGGGASASIGQNRSFGNGSKDLQLNYTGGGAVFAKNNWWGDVTGLQAGRVTLSASTTVDSTAFLTTDPRP